MTKVDPFINSVAIGDLTAVKRILKDNKNSVSDLFNLHDSKGKTPIHLAAGLEETDILQELLDAGADPNTQDYDHRTPLFEAILAQNKKALDILISCDAFLEVSDHKGFTPIHMAAKSKDEEILNCLCEEGVDVSCKSNSGMTPLSMAAREMWASGVNMLIDYGAHVKDTTAVPVLLPLFKRANLKELWDNEELVEIVKTLVAKGAEANLSVDDKTIAEIAISDPSYSGLFEALMEGDCKWVEEQLNNGKYPLQLATERGNVDYMTKLIEKGANINRIFPDNSTYLHIAAGAAKKEAFDYLLNLFKETAPDYIETAREFANWIQEEKEAMKSEDKLYDKNGKERPVVLKPIEDRYNEPRKIDHFWVDKAGNTVLLRAAKAGAMDIVEELIELGVDPSVENKKRQSAYTVVSREEAAKILDLVSKEKTEEILDLMKVIEPYHSKCDAPKKMDNEDKEKTAMKTRKRNNGVSVATKAAQFDEKKRTTPVESSIARPWGGSIEAERFMRNTRKELRNLRKEMMEKACELKNQISELYEQYGIDQDEQNMQ